MKNLIRFLSPYKGKVAIMLILLFLQVLGTLYIPTLTADIVNNGIVTGDLNHVWRTGGFMLVVAVMIAVVSISECYFSTSIFAWMGRDIRNALFKKSQTLTVDEFNRFGAASMITRCTNDITQIQQACMAATEMLLPAPVMTIAGLILAFSKSPVLAFSIMIAMVFICILTLLLGKKAMPLFSKLQELLDKMNRVLRENLTGIRVIRAFNRTEYEKKRVGNTFDHYAGTAIRVNRIFAVMIPIIMLIMNFCTIFIVGVGGQSVAQGQMQIGDIMAIVEYGILILMYLIMGMMIFMIVPRAQTCANRVNEVLSVPNLSAPKGLAGDGPEKRLVGKPENYATLEFRNVTFQYQGAEKPVLNNISFCVETGKTTAIIGGTGSGKSTIASLIPRFYDIQSGSIRFDGMNITQLSRQTLREKIGFVPQKAYLFSGTIVDNFRHGRKDASMEDIRNAAQIAQIDDFIMGLENGYDSSVSQGGSNFSGGQKQRLSIARALVKKPELYVFDDSLSALDFKTESQLRAALKKEVKDAAVLLVAQRISTIMEADRIVVLDEGRVAGIGTHKELMTFCTVYQQIARSQLGEEELA